jgi:DNA-binding transcriptional regulator YiaG
MTKEGLLSLIAARRYAKSGAGKAIRERAGLSMSAVGRAAGVTGQAVKGWESGKFMPSSAAAVLWVQLLDALAEQEQLAGEPAQTA